MACKGQTGWLGLVGIDWPTWGGAQFARSFARGRTLKKGLENIEVLLGPFVCPPLAFAGRKRFRPVIFLLRIGADPLFVSQSSVWKETEMSLYHGADPSTGNDKMIHNFKVTGTGIGKALAPGGVVAKDRVSIVEAGVDVAALPGMFSATGSQMSEEVQGVTKAANSMLATLSGKRAQLHDIQWKTLRKNSLGAVKKETDLFTLLEAAEDLSVPVFKEQDSRIRMFMYQRRYDDNQITDYLEYGLLPTILLDGLISILGPS
jgi:hypothetical protein